MGIPNCPANNGKSQGKVLKYSFSKNKYIILYAQCYREAVTRLLGVFSHIAKSARLLWVRCSSSKDQRGSADSSPTVCHRRL